eukprot:231598-Pelagomonas_calceolata.AAC.7
MHTLGLIQPCFDGFSRLASYHAAPTTPSYTFQSGLMTISRHLSQFLPLYLLMAEFREDIQSTRQNKTSGFFFLQGTGNIDPSLIPVQQGVPLRLTCTPTAHFGTSLTACHCDIRCFYAHECL